MNLLSRHSFISMRNFILGKDQFIISHTQYKRVLLTGQLAVVSVAICMSYLAFDLASGVHHSWPIQLGCAFISWLSFLFNRNGNYSTAKILLGLSINVTVFILSTMEPFEIGLYPFFIVCGLGALAAFGYEERGKAIFFILLSITLFLLSFIIDFDFLPHQTYSHDYIRINIIGNFLGASVASVLIIYFLINVNHHSEASLRENEKQIQEKIAELTKLNTELDRFVYSTSHDLRAPISSIQGLIQLVKMTTDPAEIRQYIEIMEGRLHSLNKFIGDISDYSRNARVEVKNQTVLVNRTVRDILESLKFYPGARKINVSIDIPEELEITTDPVRLRIILSNLISNSFKYADIQKENPYIRISAQRLNSRILFQIEDNGVGIREEYIPKIFDMFFQAHEKSEGSGLGLYIVKETIQKLGGRINVKSGFGIGSTFDVSLQA